MGVKGKTQRSKVTYIYCKNSHFLALAWLWMSSAMWFDTRVDSSWKKYKPLLKVVKGQTSGSKVKHFKHNVSMCYFPLRLGIRIQINPNTRWWLAFLNREKDCQDWKIKIANAHVHYPISSTKRQRQRQHEIWDHSCRLTIYKQDINMRRSSILLDYNLFCKM